MVLGELNVGSDEDVDITNGLFELNVTSPDERRLAYTQLLGTDTDGDDKYWANLGALLGRTGVASSTSRTVA